MVVFLKNILQLMLAPTKGWEDVAADSTEPDVLVRKCMFPLFVLAGLTVFVQAIYHSELSFFTLLIQAAVVFVAFFVGYIIALHVLPMYIYRFVDGEPNYRKCQVVAVYGLSMLALSMIICNVIPLTLGLPLLLPLAVWAILWKSGQYMCVRRDHEGQYAAFVLGVIVSPAWLIRELFSVLM